MNDFELPPLKTTLIATGIALVIAALVLVIAILPAEYGIDPTGAGDALGFKQLSDDPDEVELNVTVASTPLFTYNATWPTTTSLLADISGNLAEGESETINVQIEPGNFMRLDAQLSWVDETVAGQDSGPDTFEITITDQEGNSRSWQGQNQGPAGAISAAFFVQDIPNSAPIDAPDEDSARTQFNHIYPGRSSFGEWSIEIILLRADGIALLPDAGNDWSLQVFATTYELVLGDPAPAEVQQNQFQVTVPAFSGVEYKVFMREGRNMEYSWNAPFDLFYDFHGVQESGEEVSHETATAASRSNTFIAPFEGKHGWYWQNDSAQDVTVALTLRGEYVVFE